MKRVKDEAYWKRVRKKAQELKSDGCSGVPDFYLDCCLAHDIAYRTHANVDGLKRTKAQADREFRECIQSKSALGKMSPMSWWRWLGVKWFGKKSWKH